MDVRGEIAEGEKNFLLAFPRQFLTNLSNQGMQNKNQTNADGENRYGGRRECGRRGEFADYIALRSAGEDLVTRTHHTALQVGAHQEPLSQQQPD